MLWQALNYNQNKYKINKHASNPGAGYALIQGGNYHEGKTQC